MPGHILPLHRIAGSRAVRSAVNAGFHAFARRRMRRLDGLDPVEVQERSLLRLVHHARHTRFGRDHRFGDIHTVSAYQAAVPVRTYEDLWTAYLKDHYPCLDDLTWPGHVPYLALTSGTTQGATKYIPVTSEMVRSNLKASKTMVASYMAAHPESRLFHGKLFFLGGSTELERPAENVRQGDLSGIAALRVGEWLRPFTFPPLELALDPDWDRKLTRLAEQSLTEPIRMVGGVPSWLLVLFGRLLQLSGKRTVGEVWPDLEIVVHGGVKFDPYQEAFRAVLGRPEIHLQETYPCSEGFIAYGCPESGHLRLIFDHGIFYEFVPLAELGAERPTRHWLGNAEAGVNYAIVVTTCAGLWSHVIGDTVRFESLSPPLLRFTGRTKYALSAFGEHLISEEVEAAMATAARATNARVGEWHVGPVFDGALGHHRYVVEFLQPPNDLEGFRGSLDADLQDRNADYQAHRAEGVGLPLPEIVVARTGGFEAWLRAKGKLGGQHKVPRMDNTGALTTEIVGALESSDLVGSRLAAGGANGGPGTP